MPTPQECKIFNERFLEYLDTPQMHKTAADSVNDWTRTHMQEDGFFRKQLPPVKIDNDQLDRRIETDLPYKIVDKEPFSPAAASVPFGQTPQTYYIFGPRYGVGFDRIISPRWTKDVEELRTYIIDIRQVLTDNGMRAMLAEEDTKWIAAVNSCLLGPDIPVPYNGNEVMWRTLSGGVTRENFAESLKIVPRGPSRLQPTTLLLNHITIVELLKWGRDEMGGDFSQDLAKKGWTNDETEFWGRRLIVTIKRELVPDNTIFFFPDPKYLGKHFMLEETTAWVKREAFLVEFFMYQTSGASIGHAGGLGRVDFA